MRGLENEYKRRNVQPLLVLAQQTFQLKRPKECDKKWDWPEEIPTEVLFDPLSTVSATYGLAFQMQFRDGTWSSRPTIFVMDRDGVLRYVVGRHEQDIREEGIFPALDELEQQRRLIIALQSKDEERREAAQALVLFADANTRPALERALADPKPGVRVYAIQALSMLGPLPRTKENERILTGDPAWEGVRTMMAAALARADRPNQAELRKELADYDLRKMDSARVGELAPDFTLADFTGKTYRLSQFRGKQTVVLRFILYDY